MSDASPESPHRLLIISPWKRRWSLGGGAGVSDDVRFIEKFTARGWELHFLIPRGDSDTQSARETFTVHTYPNFFDATARWPIWARRIVWPLLYFFVVAPRALFVARSINPNIVLGHTHHSSLTAYLVREFFNIPSVVKLFGVMDLVHVEWPRWKYLRKNFEQIAALKVPQDAWIILDDGTHGDKAARRHGVAPDKIHFLPNGIDLEWAEEKRDRGALCDEMGIDRSAHVVLFLARLVASKQPELFIDMIPHALAAATRPPVFLVAGDGPERGACEARARELGVNDHVAFLGAVAHDRVPDVMAVADVFVSTSRLTNVAIPTCEALVCGVPVVAFDEGNTRDVIRDGETGRVVATGDVRALGAAVADLLGDDGTRMGMSVAARRFAREHFTSWDDRTNLEVEILSRLVDASRSAAFDAA